jgi:hypothetical protein
MENVEKKMCPVVCGAAVGKCGKKIVPCGVWRRCQFIQTPVFDYQIEGGLIRFTRARTGETI